MAPVPRQRSTMEMYAEKLCKMYSHASWVTRVMGIYTYLQVEARMPLNQMHAH